MSKHITFDLETLGKGHNAAIVQIGAVKFKSNGKITDSIIINIDFNSLEKYNFQTTYSTIEWWLQQDKEAIDSVFNINKNATDSSKPLKNRVSIKKALKQFAEWIGKADKYDYWSHTSFDPPILEDAYRKVGITNPIPYKRNRDIRTLSYFAGDVKVDVKGIHHNALDDCIYQAAYITECFKRVKQANL